MNLTPLGQPHNSPNAPRKQSKNAKRSFCGDSVSRVPSRMVAAALLAFWAARIVWLGWHTGVFPAFVLGVLALLTTGGCLWWVAHRQVGTGGAFVALALLVSMPVQALWSGAEAVPGLFAMLYTAVGVAHALQGPRRKWGPRILLMAGLCGFTALMTPGAAALGLGLAAAAMLYLAEGRRRWLPLLFGFWTGFATLGAGLHQLALRRMALHGGVWSLAVNAHPGLHSFAGVGLAAVAASVLWGAARRSRYFGNTAPLVAALLIGSAGLVVGPLCLGWGLPFALLYIAGVFADGLESRAKLAWIALTAGLIVFQLFFLT